MSQQEHDSSNTEIQTTELNRVQFNNLIKNNTGVLVFKLGAEWCGPCNRIKNLVHKCVGQLPSHVTFYAIDVDDSFDLYAHLKHKKIVTSIPTLLAYNRGSETPDKVIMGTNMEQIEDFFTNL